MCSLSGNVTVLAGLICVNMKNFMCHRNFTQNFYAGVNYITGENGSGKSAVIVAISAALGANFNKMGKGDDISNMIGTAEPIAVVTVTLRNDPSNSRHCDKYKNPVVIERTLVRRGEGGKISNKNAIKIDGKEVRKSDLVELMSVMSIDVCNPAVVLHQDAAKSFGDQNDGKTLYKYFLSATGLQQSLEECERCRVQVMADKVNLKQCIDVQQKLKDGDYADAKLAMEKCSDLNDLRSKIEALKADLSLLSIHEVVEKLDDKSHDLRECQSHQTEFEAQAAQLRLELAEMQAQVAANERQGSTELEVEIESITQQLKHLTKKSQGYSSDQSKKLSEKTQVETNIRRIEKQIRDEEKARDEARAEFERQDRNKGRRDAAKLKEEAESLLQRIQQREAELQAVEADIEDGEHEMRRSHSQFEDAKSSIANLDDTIRKTKSSRGKAITREEIIKRFENPYQRTDLVKIRNAIDAAHKRGLFRGRNPIGPLGAHITLKPEARKFCKPIFMSLGPKHLGAFCFDGVEDREAFKASREYQAIGRPDFVIYALSSSAENQNESTPTFQALPGSSTFSCLDLVIFDNPWVKNALLQFAKIDKAQVVDGYDKSLGHKALDSLRGKRQGTSVIVRSIDGHECTATVGGGIQATTQAANCSPDVFDRPETVDVEASLREMEAEKQNLTREYQHLEREKRSVSDRVRQLRDRMQRLQSEITGYQKKRKQNLSDARDLEHEAEQMPDDFDESSFEETIRSKQILLDARNEELSRFESELESIRKSNAEVQAQMNKESEKRRTIESKLQSRLPPFVSRSLFSYL